MNEQVGSSFSVDYSLIYAFKRAYGYHSGYCVLVNHLMLAFVINDNYSIIVVKNCSPDLKTVHQKDRCKRLSLNDFIQQFVL